MVVSKNHPVWKRLKHFRKTLRTVNSKRKKLVITRNETSGFKIFPSIFKLQS